LLPPLLFGEDRSIPAVVLFTVRGLPGATLQFVLALSAY